MASDEDATNVAEGKTFFTEIQTSFPDITSDGKIDTVQFLKAAGGIVILVEQFGKVFSPVKYDMSGNIEKLTRKFETDEERFRYLNDMILSEKEGGPAVATEALLWLKRGLCFFLIFLQCLVDDHEDGKKSENLVPFLQKAYRESLQRYHGWVTQKLFGFLCRMCPGREAWYYSMALGHKNKEDMVVAHMKTFLPGLENNVQVIVELYKTNNLESDAIV